MENLSLKLKVIFIVLILLGTGQAIFYLYSKSRNPQTTNISLDPQIATPSYNDRAYILDILEKENLKLNFVSVIDHLKYGQLRPCALAENCIEYHNETDDWRAHSNIENSLPPLPSNRNFFVLKVSLKSVPFDGGITLASEPTNTSPQNIFIGLGNNNHRFIIYAHSDLSKSNIPIFVDETIVPFSTFYLVFDRYGKYLAIADENFSTFKKYVDINEASEGLFPNGIFEDGVAYLGFGVSPKSYIFIPRILYSPL